MENQLDEAPVKPIVIARANPDSLADCIGVSDD
jgi:hypothetical protein